MTLRKREKHSDQLGGYLRFKRRRGMNVRNMEHFSSETLLYGYITVAT
jgi:hypothetical protein